MDSARGRAASEFSVSELTRLVRELVEGEPRLSGVWVRGEASNVRLAGSGHLYFTLKDAGAELRVAFFSYGKRRARPPAEGAALLVRGDVRVYEKRGEYQLVADDLIAAGQGDLAARFEALKLKLNAEGLFAEERKVPLPGVPRRVAIVTGLATAALQDVLNVLGRRAPYATAVLFPTAVQGETAPGEIAAALKAADACPGIEVILLVRGGGSIEDLWCFNDEGLARVLAAVERPLITGVGHEIDFTIADLIADRRAPTPSAAAELVCPAAQDLQGAVHDRLHRLLRLLFVALSDSTARLERLFDRRLLRDVVGGLAAEEQELDDLAVRLAGSAAAKVHLGRERGLGDLVEQLALPVARRLREVGHMLPLLRDDVLRAGRHALDERDKQQRALANRLSGLDPRAPKKLGFSIVWDSLGNIVRAAERVQPGALLRIELPEGELDAERR